MSTQELEEAERAVHLPEARGLGAWQGVALLVAGLHVQVAVPGPRQRQHLLALLRVDVPRHLQAKLQRSAPALLTANFWDIFTKFLQKAGLTLLSNLSDIRSAAG